MEPTCTDTIVHSVADAHTILYAVYQGLRPMVHRRPCNDDERARIRSGAVFVWEEGSGIERWTDRKEWGDSRSREDFLFYTEGTKSPRPDDNSSSLWPADPLVKQTYTALVKRAGADRKWHLIAYYTEGTKPTLRAVAADSQLAALRVPPGLFAQARLPKSRRVRDRPWTTGLGTANPAANRERRRARRAAGALSASHSVAGAPSAPHGALGAPPPPPPPPAALAVPSSPADDSAPAHAYAAPPPPLPRGESSLVHALSPPLTYASAQYPPAYVSSASAAASPPAYVSPASTAPSPPAYAPAALAPAPTFSTPPALPPAELAPVLAAVLAPGAQPSAPVSEIRAREVVLLTPLGQTTHGGFPPRHPIDMRALHRLQVAC